MMDIWSDIVEDGREKRLNANIEGFKEWVLDHTEIKELNGKNMLKVIDEYWTDYLDDLEISLEAEKEKMLGIEG